VTGVQTCALPICHAAFSRFCLTNHNVSSCHETRSRSLLNVAAFSACVLLLVVVISLFCIDHVIALIIEDLRKMDNACAASLSPQQSIQMHQARHVSTCDKSSVVIDMICNAILTHADGNSFL